MKHTEAELLLDELVDRTLSPELLQSVREHVQSCTECTKAVRELASLKQRTTSLPLSMKPAQDLWPLIASEIPREPENMLHFRPTQALAGQEGHVPDRSWIGRAAAVAAVALLLVGGFWMLKRSRIPSWSVQRTTGMPRIGTQKISGAGTMFAGDWLETDSLSSARVTIATIGEADLGPNSRLRLVTSRDSEHRLELARGDLRAQVSSPPRIFIVETPSATAVDLGCAYELHVDERGNSVLHVTAGDVSLEFNGRTAFVPAFALCESRRGFGPGTPYSEETSDEFRTALSMFDFNEGGAAALNVILTFAVGDDAISLWHLIPRTVAADRERVVDRLAEFYAMPRGVTRDGVLQLDSKMLDEWLGEFTTRIVPMEQVVTNAAL